MLKGETPTEGRMWIRAASDGSASDYTRESYSEKCGLKFKLASNQHRGYLNP